MVLIGGGDDGLDARHLGGEGAISAEAGQGFILPVGGDQAFGGLDRHFELAGFVEELRLQG